MKMKSDSIQLSEDTIMDILASSKIMLTSNGLRNLKMNINNTYLPIPTIHSMRIVTQVKAINSPSIIVIDAYPRKYTF